MEVDSKGRIVRRPPPPGGGREPDAPGFPEFEHDQWTFEGQIERLGTFARGVNRASGLRRGIGVFLALAVLAPLAMGAVIGVWSLLVR